MSAARNTIQSVAIASLAELSALESAVVSHFGLRVFTVRIRRWDSDAGTERFVGELSHDGVDSETIKTFVSLEFPDVLFGELPASLRQESSPPVTITSTVIVSSPD